MRPHEFERRAVTETRRHLGRTDDVGEHDGPQPGIHRGRDRAGAARGSPMRPRNASTVARSTGMMALGISPWASRWTRSAVAGSGAWTRQKATHFAHRTNRPCIFRRVGPECRLPAVRLSDILRLRSAQVVAVHVNRHVISLGAAALGPVARRSQPSREAALTCASPRRSWVCSRRLFRQTPRLVRTGSARENGGKYLLLATTATDDGTTAERVLSPCRNVDAKRNRSRRIVWEHAQLPCRQESPHQGLCVRAGSTPSVWCSSTRRGRRPTWSRCEAGRGAARGSSPKFPAAIGKP